jgi:hypothetical protein
MTMYCFVCSVISFVEVLKYLQQRSVQAGDVCTVGKNALEGAFGQLESNFSLLFVNIDPNLQRFLLQ